MRASLARVFRLIFGLVFRLILPVALGLPTPACQSEAREDSLPIGLLLSYSGDLAANSINSERALLLAIEAANRAGGVSGRPVVVVARDTGSDPTKVTGRARALLEAGAQLFIGPDTTPLAVELKSLLGEHTMIMPSFATASDFSKPRPWFVMGPSPTRVACELLAQLAVADRRRPLLIADPAGYSSVLAIELMRSGVPSVFLPSSNAATAATVQSIRVARADAFVLATVPSSATALLYTLAAVGALEEPGRWHLSPTLHTPALLETIPKGLMQGARGVAAGTLVGATAFHARFYARWQDQPLDDAYPFYDAGVIAVLALQRAVARQGAVPPGTGLVEHIVAVTGKGGIPVGWNEIDRGLALLLQGQEIGYTGLLGRLEFDVTGQTGAAGTHWWTIDGNGFSDVPGQGNCP